MVKSGKKRIVKAQSKSTGVEKQDRESGEFDQFQEQMKQFNPRKWQAAYKHRQRMHAFAPGTFDPGPASLERLKPGEVGLFIPDGKNKTALRKCANPDPKGSFGFIGAFGELVSKSSFTPGTLVLRFDPGKRKAVSRQTLRLFRWDVPTKSYRKVGNSGVGSAGDYVWGRITKPGKYAVIGLNAHPLVIRTLAISAQLMDLMGGLKPDLRKQMQDRICALMLGSAKLNKAIEDPQVIERLIEGSWPKEFPDPMEAWKPNPGFDAGGDPIEICPRMPLLGWPEWQLLPGDLWTPGGGWGGYLCFDSGWQNVGPANVSGCVFQVAIDRRSHHRLYAASADGGIWRLDDVTRYPTTTWVPLTDGNTTLKTTAVAVAPGDSNIIYMADGLNNLLRSDTAGASWYPTSTTDLGTVRRIIVNPTASDVVYLATSTGFWRSRDGGVTWDSNPGLTTLYDGDVTDLAMDPDSQAILYMTVRGVGLLKSYTSGRRWQVMLAWDPGHWYWADRTARGSTMPKLGLAALGDDSNRTVVVKFGEEVFVNRNGGRPEGSYGGGPWVSKGMRGGTGYGDWCHVLAVDPFNSAVILAGAQELMRTEDGGDRWDRVVGFFSGSVHVDQQSIAFDRAERNVVYISNDGGVFRSVDDGRTWTDLNQNLVTAQFYLTGIAGNKAMNGMYHEGIAASTNLPSRDWSVIEGGSWEFSNVSGDPRRSNYFYVLQSTLDRRRWPGTGTGDFIIPFGNFQANTVAVDPRPASNTLLAGTVAPGTIRRALDGGSDAPTWRTEGGVNLTSDPIVSIAFAPSHPGMAYAVSGSGRIFRKLDVNSSSRWEERGRWSVGGIVQLAVNPLHEDRLYLIAGNQVARSEDGGNRWIPIPGSGTNTLPNMPLKSIVPYTYNGETLFAAQSVGVFITTDEGLNWHPFNDGLPNASLMEIEWTGNYLYAVTYGRGLWRRRPCF